MITILLSLRQYNISSLFHILYSFSFNRFKYEICMYSSNWSITHLIHSVFIFIFIFIFILLQLQFNNSLPSFTYVTFNICKIHSPPPSESNQQIRFENEQKYWKSHKGNSLQNINSHLTTKIHETTSTTAATTPTKNKKKEVLSIENIKAALF